MKVYELAGVAKFTALLIFSLCYPSLGYADDGDAAEEEHVWVTGSRIRSSVSDSAQPITVLHAQDLENQGISDITRALRETTFNSIGSYRDQSGTSIGQISLIDLKGLGADRTLVLVNGRRIGGNPLTGSSAVDLNTIPMSAVDRIEILTDGASAVYGADAIGGVVNIVTKKSFSGAEVSIGHDDPSRDDASTDRFDLTFGQASDTGSVMVSLDYYKRRPIFDADRDYSASTNSAAAGATPIHFLETSNVSSFGNTGFVYPFFDAVAIGDCDPEIYMPILDPEGFPGEGCGYGFSNDAMLTGAIERTSALVIAEYNIDEMHTLYSENRVTHSDTLGRYAPSTGEFDILATNPLNTLGEDYFLHHRFLGHGNRDDAVTIREMDNLIGLEGTLINTNIHFDVFARRYQYDAVEHGSGYVLASAINAFVQDGTYDFVNPLNPTNADAILQSQANVSRDLSTELHNVGIALDGSIQGLFDWAAGVEYENERYKDQYDKLREAGNVLNAPASSARGSREHWAAFSEISIDPIETLNVKVAGRYDRYNDFGSEFSPQLAARFSPMEEVVLRASWGKGFKAPNLGNLGLSQTKSEAGIFDLLGCAYTDTPDDMCFPFYADEVVSGNPDLNAEKSESLNLGFVVTPFDGLSLSADYWRVDIEDAIYLLSVDDILSLEAVNALPEEITVYREDDGMGNIGFISSCAGLTDLSNCGIRKTFANLSKFDAEGLDVNIAFNTQTPFGDISANALWSHYFGFDEQPLESGPVFNRPGTANWPKNRFKGNVAWSRNDLGVAYTYHWIDDHQGGSADEAYNIYVQHDINAIWNVGAGVELAFGIRNFTDEDPSISTVTGWNIATSPTSTNLYDVAGRTYSATVTWRSN